MENVSIYLLLSVVGGLAVLSILSELAKVVVRKIFPFEERENQVIQTPCTACIQIRTSRDLQRNLEQTALTKEIEGVKRIQTSQEKKVDAIARLQLKMAIKMGVDIDEDIREIF